SQVRLMTLVRTYLRAQGRVGGVSISSVDLPLPAQELVQVLIPQNAIYLNSFALERMRTLSDATPHFPEALPAVLNTTRLIPPPHPGRPGPPEQAPGTGPRPPGPPAPPGGPRPPASRPPRPRPPVPPPPPQRARASPRGARPKCARQCRWARGGSGGRGEEWR